MVVPQVFRDPDCLFIVLIVINEADAYPGLFSGPANFALRAGIAVNACCHRRSRHRLHEMGQSTVRHWINTNRSYGDTCCVSSCPYVHLCSHYLLPPDGIFESNVFGSKDGMGALGNSGVALSPDAGSMIEGVTITTNSELVLLMDLERNSSPRTGISPMPGTLEYWAVVRWSSKPAMPKLWPLRSSTVVSACRVAIAGNTKPLMVTALPKSSELTSGKTFRRMVLSSWIVPVNSSFTPKGLNCTVTVL